MLRLIRWCARRCSLRVLHCLGGEYLRRYYVFGDAGALHLWPEGTKARLGWFPFAVYLHEFVQPDEDRDLHNHPWGMAVSLVLVGGYDEERFGSDDVVLRRLRPGRVNIIRRDDFHRVVRLRGGSTAWTLFITGTYVGPWGFRDRTTRQYTGWRRYLRQRGRL